MRGADLGQMEDRYEAQVDACNEGLSDTVSTEPSVTASGPIWVEILGVVL